MSLSSYVVSGTHRDARDHGLHSVGLPSRLAEFKEVMPDPTSDQQRDRLRKRKQKHSDAGNWWRQGRGAAQSSTSQPASSASNDIDESDEAFLQGFPDVQVRALRPSPHEMIIE